MDPCKAAVVLTTAPSVEDATRLARGLIDQRLCACVNITPGVRSIYRWNGAIEEEQEVQLVIKTAHARVDSLRRWLDEHHAYDVPEFLVLSAEASEGYLRFIQTETETKLPVPTGPKEPGD